MLENTYFIVPKDIIAFKEKELGPLTIKVNNKTKQKIVKRTYGISPENLISFKKNGYEINISICSLTNFQLEEITHPGLRINKYQIILKVNIKSNVHKQDSLKFYSLENYLTQQILFALILSHKINTYYYESDTFHSVNSGKFLFLPYAFFRLSETMGMSLFYQPSYEKMVYKSSSCYSGITNEEILYLKSFLEKLLKGKNAISNNVKSLFIHANSSSWVQEGLFLPLIITFFSIFESVLGSSERSKLFKTKSVLKRFQYFRHGIAHADKFRIYYSMKSRKYVRIKINPEGRGPKKTTFKFTLRYFT